MFGQISRFALISMIAAIPWPALGEEPATIKALSAPAYNVSKTLMQRGDGSVTEADAQLIKRAVLADEQVDDAEREMLDALIARKPYTIKSHAFGSDVVFTRITTDEANAVLREIASASYDDPILKDWMSSSPDDVAKVVSLYQSGEINRLKVLESLGARAKAANDKGWEDNYSKLRREVALWLSKCLQLKTRYAAYRACRRMIHDSFVHADMNGRDNTTGNIPDHFYQELKPQDE